MLLFLNDTFVSWARGVVMVVGDLCFNFLLVLWVGVR